METRQIHLPLHPLDVVLRAMPSKSMTHRALVAAALARGTSMLRGPLLADDTRVTREGLSAMGVEIHSRDGGLEVWGTAGAPHGGARVDLRDSGTSLRFLVAIAALSTTPSRFDGSARLRERPIGELVSALGSIGVRIVAEGPAGGLPLSAGGVTPLGGVVRLAASRSSQFASALLLAGPLFPRGLELILEPPVVSRPYIEVTAAVMAAFGVGIERPGPLHFRVRPECYTGRDYTIEGDHSSASYFLAAAAVVGGRVRIEGLSSASLQPDARLGPLLRELGCGVEHGPDWIEVRGTGRILPFDVDLTDAPDLAPTLAVLAPFASGACRLRGLSHLRLKESDRLAALAQGLVSLGCEVQVLDEGIVAGPSARGLRGARIDPVSDHRLAMAFAVAGLRVPGVEICEPACVAKSNPAFWDQFARLEGVAPA